MIPDIDIYRSANILIKRHGQDAPIHAAMRADAPGPRHGRCPKAVMRADAMLDKGALDGFAVWKRVLRVVEELQKVEPGAQVH